MEATHEHQLEVWLAAFTAPTGDPAADISLQNLFPEEVLEATGAAGTSEVPPSLPVDSRQRRPPAHVPQPPYVRVPTFTTSSGTSYIDTPKPRILNRYTALLCVLPIIAAIGWLIRPGSMVWSAMQIPPPPSVLSAIPKPPPIKDSLAPQPSTSATSAPLPASVTVQPTPPTTQARLGQRSAPRRRMLRAGTPRLARSAEGLAPPSITPGVKSIPAGPVAAPVLPVGPSPAPASVPPGDEVKSISRQTTAGARQVAPDRLQPQRVSSAVMQARLVRQVTPKYPSFARQIGLEGSVNLGLLISTDGSVELVRILSGNPVLAEAATQAVKQWRYRPYVYNGKAVEVETTVSVRFTAEQR